MKVKPYFPRGVREHACHNDNNGVVLIENIDACGENNTIG